MADSINPSTADMINESNQILTNITRPSPIKGDQWRTDIVASSGSPPTGSTNRYSPPIECTLVEAYVEFDGTAEQEETFLIMRNDEEVGRVTVEPGQFRSVLVPIGAGYGPQSQIWVARLT